MRPIGAGVPAKEKTGNARSIQRMINGGLLHRYLCHAESGEGLTLNTTGSSE
jgi:hypothetical protein